MNNNRGKASRHRVNLSLANTLLAPAGACSIRTFSSIVLLTLFAVFLVFAATMMLFFRQENAERRSHLHHRHRWHRLTLGRNCRRRCRFSRRTRRRATNARLSGGTNSGQDDFVRPSGEAAACVSAWRRTPGSEGRRGCVILPSGDPPTPLLKLTWINTLYCCTVHWLIPDARERRMNGDTP